MRVASLRYVLTLTVPSNVSIVCYNRRGGQGRQIQRKEGQRCEGRSRRLIREWKKLTSRKGKYMVTLIEGDGIGYGSGN